MRIIAGTKRGLKLLPPKTDGTRPITDRVKESVFSVLYNKGFPEGKYVADLFSGTGSLGLEALSRGAEFCLFGEKDRRVVAILKKNIEKAGFTEDAKILQGDIFKLGAASGLDNYKFDLVFVDPPYVMSRDTAETSPLGQLLILLSCQISDDALVLVRTDEYVNLLDNYGCLKRIDMRKWGTMKVFFLQKSSETLSRDENPQL